MRIKRQLSRRDFLWNGLIYIPTGIVAVRSMAAAQQFLPNRRKAFQPVGGGGGGNDIAFRNRNQVVGTGTNATVTEPASAALNDVFWALAVCGNAATLTEPSGWTVRYSGTATGNTSFKYNLAWIRRGSSAPSLTWTISSSVYREVHVLAYSGVVTSGNPYEASVDGGFSTGTNPDCPSVTTIDANAMVLAFAVNFFGSSSAWGAPSGYTIRVRNTAGDDCVVAEKKVAVAGAENPAAYTGGGGTETQWTASVALQD
jgi:hypothetical protein